MTWQTDDSKVHRYDYSYDGLNRLTLEDYTSKILPQRVVTVSPDLPIIGPVVGMKNSKQYGLIDDLQMSYNGNQRMKVDDAVSEQLTYTGAFDFVDGSTEGDDYAYNGNGALGDAHFYIQDYQGNNRMVVNARTNEVEQVTHYYPYGGIIGNLSSNQEAQKYKYSGKALAATEKVDNLRREREALAEGMDRTYGLDLYDVEARQYDAIIPMFTSIDPLAEKYYSISPYAYCAGDPVNLVDPTGQAWMPTGDNSASFLWIPEEQSYKPDGTLKDGLYRIAIGFAGTKNKWSVTFYGSEHNWADKEYNSESNYNIGTSKATVYCEDGTTKTYDACTMPSDLNKYPTTPEGQYEAMVGDHNGYQALKMGDVGTMNESVAKNKTNSIDLGKPNIAHPEQGNVAKGVDIHKAGKSNFTAVGSNGKPVSAACLLIDRTH